MTALDALSRSLGDLAGQGRQLDLWWRDDDLQAPGPALDRLVETLGGAGIVPALAAIPALLRVEALTALKGADAAVFVHGWKHVNHAPAAEKKSEFGPHRPLAERLAEIETARERLAAVAGPRMLPCFVPPWNRIGADLTGALAGTGILALSAFASPRRPAVPADVPRLDTHVDLIDWRGTRAGISGEALAAAVVTHVGVDGPVGILSHHRVTDGRDWDEWRPVLTLLRAHPAVRWLTPGQALGLVGVDVSEFGGPASGRVKGSMT